RHCTPSVTSPGRTFARFGTALEWQVYERHTFVQRKPGRSAALASARGVTVIVTPIQNPRRHSRSHGAASRSRPVCNSGPRDVQTSALADVGSLLPLRSDGAGGQRAHLLLLVSCGWSIGRDSRVFD